MRTGRNKPSLMKCQRAEITAAETAAVVDDGKLYLRNRRHAALRLIGRMIGALIRQAIYRVHLLRGQRQSGRILHKQPASVRLHNRLSGDVILLVILYFDGHRVLLLVRQHLLERRTPHGGKGDILLVARQICRAAHLPDDLGSALACAQIGGNFQHGTLAHAEHQTVRTRVLQYRRQNAVCPVVIVRKPAKARLQSAEVNRNIRERAARQLGIYRHSAVRPASSHASGGIRIVMAAFFRGRVVCDHGINVSAVDEHGIARPSHRKEIRLRAKIRLRENRHAVARILQHTGNNCRAKRRMVDIGIARDQQKIAVIPAAIHHILF